MYCLHAHLYLIGLHYNTSFLWLIVHKQCNLLNYNPKILLFVLLWYLYFIATSRLNQLCNQIEAELGTAQSTRTSANIRTDWQERIVRREESWEEIRPLLFKEMISKEGYPPVTVSIIICTFIHVCEAWWIVVGLSHTYLRMYIML